MSDDVQTVLNNVKLNVKSFTVSEKSELLYELTELLGTNNTKPSTGGQSMSTTISDVTSAGSFIFMPHQIQGENVNITTDLSQDSSQNKQEVQEVMEALRDLKRTIDQNDQIDQDDQMNPLLKDGAKGQIEKLEAELKKKEPDNSLVEQLVKTLQKGLEGVSILAGPTMKVAELVAKAWGIPTL